MKVHLHQAIQWYFRTPVFLRLLLTVAFFMIFFGALVHWVEPEAFPTVFDGIWWAVITGSTVGYGDYVPLTIVGRIIGIFLIIAGGGLVTFYMATVSSSTVKYERNLSEGKVEYRGSNHIIIIGWNERTKQLLNMITDYIEEENIVLIDKSLDQIGYQEYKLHYINGDASEDSTLLKARISEARCMIITSDPSKQEHQADQVSILTTVAARGMNSDMFIITEILLKNQVTNARRAGADTVIRSNDFMSTLFFHELYREAHIKPFDTLVAQLSSQQYKQMKVPKDLVGETFKECALAFLKQEELLLGMEQNGELFINPPSQSIIKEDDHLIVLSNLSE
ncbi:MULTISPECIES: potassium channel family protein [Pontibacillus]|uniref:Potassium channel family protein n=1 Tax=Pontibacillus chungwhensis TaxID=265426 RepID=A0ABY8UUM0_9BACI|nr:MULTISPECIES: potassium channel family protein [Pontibacillus]MCD5325121.1 potassium channel family protein [Pontibacillus sp. HN14]WIF97371.1 potassium channel family protein [Pontibacillus chungwhensis]